MNSNEELPDQTFESASAYTQVMPSTPPATISVSPSTKRLASLSAAAAGDILVSSVAAELATGQGFELGPERVVELKGLDITHRIVPIFWSAAT